MRKLILEEWVSLDGYVTDRNGELDFFTHLTPEQNTYSDADQLKFLETIDTILLGRITYELFVQFWPSATTDQEAIADKLNETKKIVFSNSITTAPWGSWDTNGARNKGSAGYSFIQAGVHDVHKGQGHKEHHMLFHDSNPGRETVTLLPGTVCVVSIRSIATCRMFGADLPRDK